MSYIRARVSDTELDEGVGQIVGQVLGPPSLDMNLDDEMLDFVLALISKVNDLSEGEALVVWKDIF